MDKLFSIITYQRGVNWSHPPFIQSYDLLILITEGRLAYMVNGERWELEKGAAVFLPAGTNRAGMAWGESPHRKTAIRFLREQWEETLWALPLLTQGIPARLQTRRFHWMESRLGELHSEWREQRPCYTGICSGIFLELLGSLAREQAEQNAPNPFQQEIRDYIEENCTLPLTIEGLSKRCGKSGTYLITAFRKQYGEPPLSYMHRLRINQACDLLAATNLSVEEIALQLGYCDASYFHRVFRRRIGCSPSQFRKEK
ncbi:MAG: hypothetical protein K0R57_819 [Paenibacillaceae bacterium]|jgi:AraC-like DNA-binding protein|nr:hypothetical protein [Paenibacillaceae bacterium]